MNFKKKVNGSWVDTPNYIHKTDTDTFTTLPADLYPTGTTATVGLKGNTVQSGTPSPDNPIMPDGTGDKTANWFDISNVTHQALSPDGTISTESAMDLSGFIEVNGDFTVSWTAVRTGAYMRVSTYDTNKNYIERLVAMNTYTNTHYSNSHIGYIRINYENSYGLSKIMLNSGSTALPFQPYGYKIPISSGGVTTNVYLGEVQSTRQIKKLVFDGTESFVLYQGKFFTKILDGMSIIIAPYSSHYTGVSGALDDMPLNSVRQTTARVWGQTPIPALCFYNEYATDTDFKTYLAAQYAAGTPVCVWYVLATPTTGIVNEPLRKIGDYADEVSGITIPTTAGAEQFDVDTTLKPSEVSLTYHGWHEHSYEKYMGGVINKFNKDTAMGRFVVDTTTGDLVSSYSTRFASDYIDISSNTGSINISGANAIYRGAYYGAQKQYISGITAYGSLTVPQGAKFIRFTLTDQLLNTAMVCIGSTAPAEYHPYYEWIEQS